jgi:glycosyltransferase involved in cell wall biosynthesis
MNMPKHDGYEVVLFSEDYLPNIGGVAAHVHGLARSLRELERDACVVTVRECHWRIPGHWLSRWESIDDVPILRISLACLPGMYGRFWRLRKSAAALSRRSVPTANPRIFHVHDCFSGHYVAGHIRGYAKIFTNHTSGFLQGMDDPTISNRWKQRLEQFDSVIAPSQELADRTADLGYDVDRVAYIPNAVDTERFKPDGDIRRRVRAELDIRDEEVVLLCARRFVPKNGVIDFAHALRFLTVDVDRVVVLFAGDSYGVIDGYERETIGAVNQSPLGQRAKFLGPVPNERMQRLYSASDVAVLPSLKEATSITGLEAMACGLPLVGTRVGGIPDLIDHGTTGLLVEPGDPRSIAGALSLLIDNPALRHEFGRQARQKVLDQFTWQQTARRTADVYDRVLRMMVERPRDMADPQPITS